MTDTTIENGDTTHEEESDGTAQGNGGTASKTDAIKDSMSKYGAQATDKARAFADTGKDRATDALGQLSQMLHDAAGQVDERLGTQYGEYARGVAGHISTFADNLKAKDVDSLVDDARDYVRKSPAVAIGIAAALGFVVARLVQSGIDADGRRTDV